MDSRYPGEEPQSSVRVETTATGLQVRFGRGFADVPKVHKVVGLVYLAFASGWLGVAVFDAVWSATSGSWFTVATWVGLFAFAVFEVAHQDRRHRGKITVSESAVETSLDIDLYAVLRPKERDPAITYPDFRRSIDRGLINRILVHQSQLPARFGLGPYEVRVASVSGVEFLVAVTQSKIEARQIVDRLSAELGLSMAPIDSAEELRSALDQVEAEQTHFPDQPIIVPEQHDVPRQHDA